MDIAERALRTRLIEIKRMIDDLKRQETAIKADLHELNGGKPILQGPCVGYSPIKKKMVEVKQSL